MGEYETALLAGSGLSDAQRQSVAEKMHNYIGLPVAYLLKSDLRVSGGAFSRTIQEGQDLTTGRLDTRFSGPALDPLSEEAEYDPQSNAVSAAYTTAINHIPSRLKIRTESNVRTYHLGGWADLDLRHQAPGGPPIGQGEGGTNVMPDLADTMKLNPKMHVLVAGGYFDLATPFYQGIYEMHHLPIPSSLQKNISYSYYESGHMVYVNENALSQFHDAVAKLVRDTETGK